MSSSEPEASSDLKFPPVRVYQSLTKFDLETLMMRSTSRPPPQEGSALEDSSYELLSGSAHDASDDEAHTASIASTDGPTPDESDEFSDDDSDYGGEQYEQDLRNDAHSSHAELPEQHTTVHPILSGEDSTLTEVPPYLAGSESSWQIKLEEQPADEADVLQGSKVIKSLADYTSELPHVFSQYGCEQVRLVVKAALSQRPLPTPDSYRILYIGMPDKWAEDLITSQIGAALTASPGSSKSVVVRGQIEPFSPVIHRSRCAKLRVIIEHEKPSRVHVWLDDGEQLKFGPDIGAHSSGRPDLAVICHRANPHAATDEQELASASEVFGHEKIPCIELTEARPYGTGSPTDNSDSIRVCVEGRDDPSADYELKEVLPLDHYTFTRLEPSQLNRHLALISPHLLTAQGTKHNQRIRTSWIGDKYNAFTKKTSPRWDFAKVLSALVLFALVPVLFQGAAYAPMLFQKASQGEMQTPNLSEAPILASSITPVASISSSVTPPACTTFVPSAPRGLTVVPSQPKAAKPKPKVKDDKVGGFEIQTTGDHQFVLRPSKSFTSSGKKPQLQIQVLHQAQAVPTRYNRTITGDYIVDLDQQYPLSAFNVSIATHSKPLLRQSFEVMLGHNKSKLDLLLESAMSNLFNTRGNLWNVSFVAAQNMRTTLADLDAHAQPLRSAQHMVHRQIVTGAKLLKHVPGATWMGLKEATASVRTSSPILRARMNALRLRCKMEVAAGLSAKDVNGEQSWACWKVWAQA